MVSRIPKTNNSDHCCAIIVNLARFRYYTTRQVMKWWFPDSQRQPLFPHKIYPGSGILLQISFLFVSASHSNTLILGSFWLIPIFLSKYAAIIFLEFSLPGLLIQDELDGTSSKLSYCLKVFLF